MVSLALAGGARRSGRAAVSPTRRAKDTGRAWPEPVYLDASALVKLLVPEPGSAALNEALVGAEDVIISDLALTEVASALGRRVREHRVAPPDARRNPG